MRSEHAPHPQTTLDEPEVEAMPGVTLSAGEDPRPARDGDGLLPDDSNVQSSPGQRTLDIQVPASGNQELDADPQTLERQRLTLLTQVKPHDWGISKIAEVYGVSFTQADALRRQGQVPTNPADAKRMLAAMDEKDRSQRAEAESIIQTQRREALERIAHSGSRPSREQIAEAYGLSWTQADSLARQKGAKGIEADAQATIAAAQAESDRQKLEEQARQDAAMESEIAPLRDRVYQEHVTGVEYAIESRVREGLARTSTLPGTDARRMYERNLRQQVAADLERSARDAAAQAARDRQDYINANGGIDNIDAINARDAGHIKGIAETLREFELGLGLAHSSSNGSNGSVEPQPQRVEIYPGVFVADRTNRESRQETVEEWRARMGVGRGPASEPVKPEVRPSAGGGQWDPRLPLERRIDPTPTTIPARSVVEAIPPAGNPTEPIPEDAGQVKDRPPAAEPEPEVPRHHGRGEMRLYQQQYIGYTLRVAGLEGDELRSSYHERDGLPTQDRLLIDPARGAYGVIDGMGGAGSKSAGGEAANSIHDAVSDFIETQPDPGEWNAEEYMRELMAAARQSLADWNDERGAAATFVKMFKGRNGQLMAVVGHAGDTRMFVDRVDGQTADPEEIVVEQVAQTDPATLTNCIDAEPRRSVYDIIKVMEVKAGDRIILGSDGIFGDLDAERLSKKDMLPALVKSSVMNCVRRLVDLSKKDDDKAALIIDVVGAPSPVALQVERPDDDGADRTSYPTMEGTQNAPVHPDPSLVDEIFGLPQTGRLEQRPTTPRDNDMASVTWLRPPALSNEDEGAEGEENSNVPDLRARLGAVATTVNTQAWQPRPPRLSSVANATAGIRRAVSGVLRPPRQSSGGGRTRRANERLNWTGRGWTTGPAPQELPPMEEKLRERINRPRRPSTMGQPAGFRATFRRPRNRSGA